MQSFTNLIVWQLALDLVDDIYTITKQFPRDELYGLTSQIRRSSVSVVANIAEGFGRFTFDDKANRYTIARGECSETMALVHVGRRLKYISEEDSVKLIEKTTSIGKMLSGLIRSSRDNKTID